MNIHANPAPTAALHDRLQALGLDDAKMADIADIIIKERNEAEAEATKLFAKEHLSEFRFGDILEQHKRRAFGVLSAVIGGENFMGGDMADGVAQLVGDLADDAARIEKLYHATLKQNGKL